MHLRAPIRLSLLLATVATLALFIVPATQAGAAVTCPNSNPVVNENNCMGAGSSAWQLTNYEPGGITGYATQSSVNLGSSVTLRIAAPGSSVKAEVTVFRMGWYGGAGGRLVYTAKSVTVNNDRSCEAPDETTGYWSCGDWENTLTIPSTSLPASGIYLARIKNQANGEDNQVIFTVRNDARHSAILYKLPDATYQAYNAYMGHSLYRFSSSGFQTITGTSRAVKVSFDRPYLNVYDEANWFLKADFPMVEWMERQGYEIDYTDDPSVDSNPGQLLNHKTLVISGHDEYWSENEMNGYKAARNAGVNIASFSGNTAYWKVRYEDGGRTLVCYKSVEGTREGNVPDGSKGVNDWGPDGIKGTSDDAVGKDGKAGTADDNPKYATTTWRDNGAPPGDPNAPPEGRVGPDQPENSLLGSMYVGDNDNFNYPLTVPGTNEAGEYAGDRIWRNTGVSKTASTTIGTNLNGWEWDTIPAQAQYLSRQPAGVKRVSLTDVANAPSPAEYVQDEGLMYSFSPPPGQPTTVSATKYTASSGALVFAAGTIQWSWGLAPHFSNRPTGDTYEDPAVDSSDPRIQQATYNILADGGVQPQTPSGVIVDGNEPPQASFTITPNPAATGSEVTFNASASKDPDGTIAKYEWDLDGNGTYETSSGTSPTVKKSYASAGELTVALRVTDSSGATDETVRTLKISSGSGGNIFPTAAFTISPNPASPGTQVTFNASGSSDPDGTIAKYEWDLDGNGTFETSTGSTPTVSKTYPEAGTRQVGLKVTDNGGGTNTTTHVLIVGSGSPYSTEVLNTPGLLDYWRLGEASGTTLADAASSPHPATAQGGVTLGKPGAIEADPNTSASFDGGTGAASVPLNLSGSSQLTLEFWLNWSAYANNDQLAFEFTPNFNTNAGGFLVDPNAGELGGKFGIGIGKEGSRNNAYFTRPSAGVWHHYAIVFNTQAAAAQQIVPYVDGQPVSFEKLNSGTGAGNFASSTLYFMSRNASALFGKGGLDEVALYNRALSGAEIAAHYQASRNNLSPSASFEVSASPVAINTAVTFNAAGSKDPDGTIAKYEWDLDGNGTYETNTGTTASATRSYATEGTIQVGLRVTDNGGATATTTRTLVVEAHAPTASFTVSPNPATAGAEVSFDGSGSSDPDGPIAKFEWDLDGNGTFETNTGTSATVKKTYTEAGEYQVKLRVTDGTGTVATKTQTVSVLGRYASAITSTPGLADYWRLGDAPGTTFADSVGPSPATAQGGVTLGVPGAIEAEPNTAASFDGTSGAAKAPVDLSGTSQVTLEFWLNWSAYANNDQLAFEFTPNFNNESGGFLVDPNAGELGGKFGIGIGREGSRNNAYFTRPSAGVWHHYAIVMDTQAAAGQQIVPYVDGKAVPFEKLNSGTGAGNFANSTLSFMSRNASALFGKGSLDEVALYKRALTAAEVEAHYLARTQHNPPAGSFTATPNPAPTGAQVSFDASGSTDPDGTIVKYEWDLDGNGTFETNTGSTPTTSTTYAKAGEYQVGLKVTDDGGVSTTSTRALTVQNRAPSATVTDSPDPAPIGTPVTFDASGSTDPDGTIVKYEWDLDGNGTYETDTGSTPTASKSYTKPAEVQVGVRVTDNEGLTATATQTARIVGTYYGVIKGTPGLLDYWRLGERTGTTFADSVGTKNATMTGGLTLGTPGAIPTDPNPSATFNGGGAANAAIDLSGTSQVTLEFWLNWSAYNNNDLLAFEFTPNFNSNAGGFLVDPNSPQLGGKFGVGIGREGSRNNVYFERPSAGVWHHYALVFDTQAPASEQVIPYVDGKPVSYEKESSGTGAGNFANSTLNFMSRNGSALFGKGGLDEVALYGRALSPAEVAAHYEAAANKAPSASFTASPANVATGLPVSFDASASADADGSIVKYEWDLDGNGTYETTTSAPTTTKTYSEAGEYQVGLKVTDDEGGTASTTQTVTDHGSLPHAAVSASPSPAPTGGAVTFDASGSSDADGPLTYEWDLDNNGTFETNTGSTPTVTRTYAKAGEYTVGVKVTDTDTTTDTAKATVAVQNQSPTASFTAPSSILSGTQASFDASGSGDPDGTIAKYEWDLDGNGTYETDTGTTATTSKTYATPGEFTIGLRVTDDEGATATTTRALTVQNRVPTVSFTASPNPVSTGTQVTFNGAGSADPDGTIAKYEWDLDGNGTYETDTGTTATATSTYATAANLTIGLRVTDNDGATATTTRALTVQNRAPTASFTATPNPVPTGTPVSFDASGSADPDGTIAKYEWDLDGNGTYETNTGTTATTSKTYATATNLTIRLRITDNEGAATTTTKSLTVQNRLPTASFTASPNPVISGSVVSFNGSGSSDPDGTIAKYEWDTDGNGSYETSTGSTATLNKTYSTSGEFNVGLRVTDNSGGTATTTRALVIQNRAPTASFTVNPNPVPTGSQVTFSASGSTDPDGTIAKYEWDLDGNGSYETTTTSATTTKTYAAAATLTIGLRVTDNGGATATTTRSLTVQNRAPTASFTVTPNPATTGTPVSFDASGSADPDGTIAKYEWDLDGNGTYETSTGTTATTTKTYATAATLTIGLRVTDNGGATATTTKSLTVRSAYNAAILGTSGLIDYWRLGETSGTSLADAIGGRTATAQGGVTLGGAGAIPSDTDKSAAFNGTNGAATASLNNLSSLSAITVEFWMNWSTFANDNDMALELTQNSTLLGGGFFIEPNSTEQGGRFGVGIGGLLNRNNAYFVRPTAGAWHHYAFVLNTKATAATQVIPYVDGQPVSYTKVNSSTGAGNFANSTLYFMSRSASSRFGKGSLDEVAIYNRALTAAEIAAHFKAAN